jgi:hypothetical protein
MIGFQNFRALAAHVIPRLSIQDTAADAVPCGVPAEVAAAAVGHDGSSG